MTSLVQALTGPNDVMDQSCGSMSKFVRAAVTSMMACFALITNAHANPAENAIDVSHEESEPYSEKQTTQSLFLFLVEEAKEQVMRDPASALVTARQAEIIARSKHGAANIENALATALWLKGEAQLRTGQPELAKPSIEEALSYLDKGDRSSMLRGDLLLAQGRIASRTADMKTAVQSYFAAHDIFVEHKEFRKEAISLMSLASVYRDAEDYSRALDNYARAAEIFDGDQKIRLASSNNRANVLKELQRFDEARTLYEEALTIAEEMGSQTLRARIMTNIAENEILAGNPRNAAILAQSALALLGNDNGTDWARYIYGVMAQIHLADGELAQAHELIEKAFDGVDLAATSLTFEEMHDVAHQIYFQRGDLEKALTHHENFKRLSDEAKKAASSANVALLAARFHFAEQNLNIERLNSEKLQKNIMLSDAQKRTTDLAAVLAVAGVLILFFFTVAVGLRGHRNKIAMVNEKLRDTVNQLHTEISQRKLVEVDLVAAKEEAEKATRVKSTFLATMSHELRTPLNGILGFADILLESKLPPEHHQASEIIKSSGESLLSLINDILDLSQIEAGKLKIKMRDFDLRDIAENAVTLFKAKAREKGLNLALHIDPETPTIAYGDPNRVRQILINLAGNAVKFTPAGTVAVVIGVDSASGDVKFSVFDTGPGIREDEIGNLFERFSQIDDSTTRHHDGSGLGLAICKELAEAMDGEIGVESREGDGSEFWFSLPLFDAVLDQSPPLDSKEILAETARVLVVDDRRINQQIFGMMLRAIGAEHVIAQDVNSALDVMEDEKFAGRAIDAVIVSGTLNEALAGQFGQQLRNHKFNSDIKLILSTPRHYDDDALDSLGFDASIDQPITQTTVFAGLRSLISSSRRDTKTKYAKAADGELVSLIRRKPMPRLLLADDNEDNRKVVQAVLKSFDVRIDVVENGAEAVKAAEKTDYDVIMMDIYMPVMGGFEATKAIRNAGGVNANTPIIGVTASLLSVDKSDLTEIGMDDYVTKPINCKALREKISGYIEGGNRDNSGEDEKVSAAIIRIA